MEAEILDAAEALIKAYEANDRSGYFAWFTEDASFIFHGTDQVLASRAAYEAEYDRWVEEDGFAVVECSSFNRVAKVYGDVAVFTHQTFSQLLSRGKLLQLDERETIIFRRVEGRWLAVHEHVSPLPG